MILLLTRCLAGLMQARSGASPIRPRTGPSKQDIWKEEPPSPCVSPSQVWCPRDSITPQYRKGAGWVRKVMQTWEEKASAFHSVSVFHWEMCVLGDSFLLA